MGARAPGRGALPDHCDLDRRRLQLHQARPTRGPAVLRAVHDGDRDLARRDRAADPGRTPEPDGEEVRTARPLRQGRDLRAPGLWRHDDQREGRHVAQGPARSVVPGAQEVLGPEARIARRRDRPDLQRRVRRRVRADVCRQGRRHRARGTVRHVRGHQAPPAEGSLRQEGRRHGQAGPEDLRGVLPPAPGLPRHHAAGDRREPEEPECDAARRLHRHEGRPRVRARDRPVHKPRRHPQRAGRRRRALAQARRYRDGDARLPGPADLHHPPQR